MAHDKQQFYSTHESDSQATILLGKHLQLLAKKLSKTDTYVSFWVGLTINRWYQITDDGTRKKRNKRQKNTSKGVDPKELKGNQPLMPRHAILTRFLINNPEYFHAINVSFDDLFQEIDGFFTANRAFLEPMGEFYESFSYSKLAIILGLEPSAAVRVQEGANSISPTATNMINIIYINLKLAETVEQKFDLINRLKENVDEEAAARGIPYGKIWEKGGFSKLATRPEIAMQSETDKDEDD